MKILIVAGGTGGHLYPGIAVAHALKGHDVLFCVRRGDLGREILTQERFAVEEISGQGLPRRLNLQVLTFPFQFVQGFREARKLLQKVQPAAVLAMGGYLSAPVVLNARPLGIATLLHEQNVYPGLANRWLRRWATSVALSFAESRSFLSGSNVWISGLPIRPDIGTLSPAAGRAHFGLAADVPTFLVFGGSLGAQRINTLAVEAWSTLMHENHRFQVLHITGKSDFERVQRLYQSISLPAKVLPYTHEMPAAYAAASAVICRAGASTVAELMVAKRQALLVPYPYASDNHQGYNAQVLERTGQGFVLAEKSLTAAAIAGFLKKASSETSRPEPAPPSQAAERLAACLTSGCRLATMD